MIHQLNKVESENYRKLAGFYCSLDYRSGIKPEKVLEQPGDINYQFPANALFKSRKSHLIGSTALHLVQEFRNKKLFDSLLRDGADFTIKNIKGLTVLHQSVQYKYNDFKVYQHPRWFQSQINDEFAEAILTAHVESKNFNNPSDNNGISHFHIACLLDHSKAVEYFLNNGISVDQTINDNSPILSGYTPLHIAAIRGCLETAKILLKFGADMTIKDTKKMTPLRTVVNRNMEIVYWMHTRNTDIHCIIDLKSNVNARKKITSRMLSENAAGANTTDDEGFSSFHAACTLKDTLFAEQLLEKGVDLHHFVKMHSPVWPGYTCLHFAAHFNIEMVKLLLSKGANMEAQDAYGVTPFDICVERFNIEDLHSIISSHMIWKDIMLSDGTTKLIDLVYIMQNLELLSTFLELEELDINLFVPLDSPLCPGYTILHLAAIFTETIKLFNDFPSYPHRPSTVTCSYVERIEICLNKNADVTTADARGSTPLQLAFRLRKFDAVKLMLNFHPDTVNPIDNDNLSALYIACYVQDAGLVETLLSSGADANISLLPTFRWHENEDSFVHKYRSFGFKSGGLTPLHAAVSSGDKETVSLLLKYGADVNAKDDNGLTPLHLIFSCHDNHDIADMLLSSPNLKDSVFNDGLTHLHLASYFSNSESIDKLLNNGANIDATINVTSNSIFKDFNQWSRQPLSFMVEYAGCTPLHIAMGLHSRKSESSDRNPTIAKLLLQRGADMFIGNSVGRRVAYMSLTRMFLETRLEDVEITFLQNDVNLQRRMVEVSGITMLHIACWKVDVEAVKTLINQGANVNAQAHADSPVWPKWTPMHVLMLVTTNSKIDSGRIDSILRILLDNGVDLSLTNAELETPLHLTEPTNLSIEIASHVKYRSYGDSSYTGLLFDRLKDDHANPSDIAGISYFHIASLRNDVEQVKKFLQHGAEVNKAIDFFSDRYPGCTALHLALNPETSIDASSRIATVKLLMMHGADVHAQDVYGNTPLHIAVKRGLPCEALLELISSDRAEPKATNMRGETAFELLLKSENVKSEDVKYFLRRGCHINSYQPFSEEGFIGIMSTHNPLIKEIINTWEEVLEIDSIGRTAIHNLVSIRKSRVQNYTVLIEKLMRRGCDIDRQDNQGRTALHLAVKFLNYKAVFGLLQLGADVNAADADGKTALAKCFEYHEKSITFSLRFCPGNLPLQMIKYIDVYIHKMQLCGLDVHKLNIKILTDIPQCVKADNDDMKRFDEKLEKAKSVKIGSSQQTFYDFLSNTRAWESLPIALDTKPSSVDELFGIINNRIILDEFPEFIDILRLQYRKFQNAIIQPNL